MPKAELTPITPEEIEEGRKLVRSWRETAGKVKSEVKDHIGHLYIIHILGLDEETARIFVDAAGKDRLDSEEGRKYNEVYHQIGVVQSGIPARPEALHEFWEAVYALEPRLAPSDEHVRLLTQYGSVREVCDLIWILDRQDGEGETPSFVLDDLNTNAHAYK